MSLSCGVMILGDAADWYLNQERFEVFVGKRSVRCKACKALIESGIKCWHLGRFREPRSGLEWRIYGDEVSLAPWHLCERCGDIYSSLTELGFCVDPTESMDEQLAEYHRDYAKPPAPGFALKLRKKS